MRRAAACLLVLLGCSATPDGATDARAISPDTAPRDDVASDAPDTRDVESTDALDATDAADATDALDALDATDALDAPDLPSDDRDVTVDLAPDVPNDVPDDTRDVAVDLAPVATDARDAAPVDTGCARPMTLCDGRCVDTRVDDQHCGICGNRCGAGLSCADSFCRCASARGASGDSVVSIRVGGESRSVRLHVPPTYLPRLATPLVLNYHGFSSTPAEHEADTSMDAQANLDRFLVAYPEGLYRSWNANICCPLATTLAVDDLAFFDAIVRTVSASHCVDPRRVHVAGYSNGAMMAQRIACLRADRVASLAAVSGTYDGSCSPSRPMPILYLHAVDDRVVPYDGGAFSGVAGVVLPSVATTLSRWRAIDGCGATTETLRTVGDSTCLHWRGCRAEVEHCRIGSGGHRWPRPPQSLLATPTVAAFFRAHPLP